MSNTPWAPWKYRLGCISFLTFSFYFFHLLYNSHTTKYTLWKWAILTTLVYSQGRVTLTTVYSQNIFIPPKRKPIPISHSSPFPPAPNLWQPPIYFLFCGFAFSRRFMEMESCNMWSFVSGFFYLASCDQGCPPCGMDHCFNPFYGQQTPWYTYRTFCFVGHQWLDGYVSFCLSCLLSSSFPLLFLLASLLHSSFLPLFLLFSLRRLWLHTYCVTGTIIKHLIKPPAWCKLKGTMYHFFKWMLHFKTGLDLLISYAGSTECLSTRHPVSLLWVSYTRGCVRSNEGARIVTELSTKLYA